MKTFKQLLLEQKQSINHQHSLNDEKILDQLNEAGTLDSGLTIKRLNDVKRFGKDVLRARSVEDKLDALARQNFAVGGLALMAIAVSGDKSFMSRLATGFSLGNL